MVRRVPEELRCWGVLLEQHELKNCSPEQFVCIWLQGACQSAHCVILPTRGPAPISLLLRKVSEGASISSEKCNCEKRNYINFRLKFS